MGDFVKGSQLEHLPEDIRNGVLLHRSIDSFTDRHALVMLLKQQCPKHLRRMSGVIIDIYFDHLLCLHWQKFSALAINDTLTEFYTSLANDGLVLSDRFHRVKQGLLSHQWLIDYQDRKGCLRAFHQIENRLNGRIQFAEQAGEYLVTNHASLEKAFLTFYPKLIQHVSVFAHKQSNRLLDSRSQHASGLE